jgi:AcrR family transcriptional regulator
MMTARPTKKRHSHEERSLATRQKLCDATLQCLAELGYKKTSVSAIVKKAGTTVGARLHHYPYKIDLVEAAFEYHFETAIRRADEFFGARQEVSLQEFFDFVWLDTYHGTSFPAVIEGLVAARADEELQQRLTPLFEHWYQYQNNKFRSLFEKAMPSLPLETLWSATTALFRGMMVVQPVRPDPAYYRQLIDLWLNMVCDYAAARGYEGDLITPIANPEARQELAS